ncbi:MAG: hypothetical protein IKA54_01640 [Clostridia bacterium]|nr:hypothetical protein [Clostridia bacterium]
MDILIFSIALSFTVARTISTKSYNKTGGDVYVFNLIVALSSLLPLLIYLAFGINFNLPTIIFGVIYGFLLAVSNYAGFNALKHGPMALSGMITSFSVAMPLIFGLCIGESLSVFGIVGLLCLASSIIVLNINGKTGEKINKKWVFYVTLNFLVNGLCSITQKIYQLKANGVYSIEFTLVAMLVCFIIYLALTIIKAKGQFKKSKKKFFGVISGIATATVTFCTTLLVSMQSAVILFPTLTAGTIATNVIFGRVFFKEKFKINHYLSILFGMLAVVLLRI